MLTLNRDFELLLKKRPISFESIVVEDDFRSFHSSALSEMGKMLNDFSLSQCRCPTTI